MRELSFLNKGITINLTDKRRKDEQGNDVYDKFHSEEGLKEYIRFLTTTVKPSFRRSFLWRVKNGIPVEVAMIYNTSFNENLHSYVNNINTHEGGTHLSGF